jgi:xylan 1,4-beta-xylosidase
MKLKKFMLMLGLTWGLFLMAEGLASVTLTGPVISAEVVRGHSDELVYTVRDFTTGKEYKAVTLRSDIARNEQIFKEALTSGQNVHIEFIPHSRFTDNIYKIHRIGLGDASAEAKAEQVEQPRPAEVRSEGYAPPQPIHFGKLSEREALYLTTLGKLQKAARPVERTFESTESEIIFSDQAGSGKELVPFWRTLVVPDRWLSPPAWAMPTSRPIFELLNRETGFDYSQTPVHALLADKISTVRILGGWKTGGSPEDVDVVTSDGSGGLIYHWDRLFARLDPIVTNGLTPFVVLDNVPFALAPAHSGPLPSYGQNLAPKDFVLWERFIEDLCMALAERYGRETAGSWRYRIGTELDNPNHWESRAPDSLEKYLRTYDHATAAVKRVFPNAHVGPGNFNSMFAGQLNRLVDPVKMFQHFANGTNYATGKIGSPVDFISISSYGAYWSGGRFDHPDAARHGFSPEVLRMHAALMKQLRGMSSRFEGIPIEVHEHRMLRNEYDALTAEPGSFGGAWQVAQYAVALQEGISEIFIWDDARPISGRSMLFASAWVRIMMEKMVGGEFLDPRIIHATHSNWIYGFGIRQPDRLWIVLSNYHADRQVAQNETVHVRLAPQWTGEKTDVPVRMYRLNQETAPYDVMFSDLRKNGQLKGQVNVLKGMATKEGVSAVTSNINKYWMLQEASFIPHPVPADAIEPSDESLVIRLDLQTPEVVILEIMIEEFRLCPKN